MARHRADPAEWFALARGIRRLRCGSSLRSGRDYCRRARRVHQRPGFAGVEEADGLSRVWHALYAGKSVGSTHGLYGRGMRRLLSLSAPCSREVGESVSTKTDAEIKFELSCPTPLPAKDT